MKLGTASINHATKVKIRAEVRVAELVDEGQATGQIATRGRPKKVGTPDLSSVGLTKQQVTEARAIRTVVEDLDLDTFEQQHTAADKEISRASLLKEARKRKRQEVEHTPAMPDAELPDDEV